MLKVFTWDWKAPAPVMKICDAIMEAASGIAPDLGCAHYFYYKTGSDNYAFVVADYLPSPEEVEEAYRS